VRADLDDDFSARVPEGTYRIRITDAAADQRLPYDDAWSGGDSADTADRVEIVAGALVQRTVVQTRTTPASASTVQGTVTFRGAVVPGARVVAWARAETAGWRIAHSAYADSQGRYELRGLRTGTYRFQFGDDPRWTWELQSEFSPGVPFASDATPIVVADGGSVVLDHDLSRGLGAGPSHWLAVIRGTVVAADTGHPLPAATVTFSGDAAPATTGTDGVFEVGAWGYRDFSSITGVVTVAAPGYAPVTTTLTLTPGQREILALSPLRVPAAGIPALSTSTPRVGAAVRATVSGWTPAMTYRYQWRRDGAAIAGATGASYTPTAGDRGHRLTVAVTGARAGYAAATRISAERVVGSGILATTTPKITGTRKVGRTLTASPGSWTSGVTFSYRWYNNGKAITGATKKTYRLTWRDARDRITVKVTAKKSGYTTASRTSARTARIAW
jgi:hypothetical protein